VLGVDAIGNFDRFFPSATARDLFGTTIPGRLAEALNPHVPAEELSKVKEALDSAAYGNVGSVHRTMHSTKHGVIVGLTIVVLARWADEVGECTLVKEWFSDVTASVALGEERSRQAQMKHNVRNMIDLARYYLDEGRDVNQALQVLDSVSSTIRFTEGLHDVSSGHDPFHVISKVESVASLLLEGMKYSFRYDEAPRLSTHLLVLSVSDMAFECGILKEVFLNMRKHACVSKPITITVAERSDDDEGMVLELLVVNAVREAASIARGRGRSLVSTGTGSERVGRLITAAGGRYCAEPFGNSSFRTVVRLPVRSLSTFSPVILDEVDTASIRAISFVVVEDSATMRNSWEYAFRKEALPVSSYLLIGEFEHDIIDIADQRRSNLNARLRMARCNKEVQHLALVLDNNLGYDDCSGEDLTGVKCLKKLLEAQWFVEAFEEGFVHVFFNSGETSASIFSQLAECGVPVSAVSEFFQKPGPPVSKKLKLIASAIESASAMESAAVAAVVAPHHANDPLAGESPASNNDGAELDFSHFEGMGMEDVQEVSSIFLDVEHPEGALAMMRQIEQDLEAAEPPNKDRMHKLCGDAACAGASGFVRCLEDFQLRPTREIFDHLTRSLQGTRDAFARYFATGKLPGKESD